MNDDKVIVLVYVVGQTPNHKVIGVSTVINGRRVTPWTTFRPVVFLSTHVRLVVVSVTTPDPNGPGVQTELNTVDKETSDPLPTPLPSSS